MQKKDENKTSSKSKRIYLRDIDDISKVKKLDENQCEILCKEIRSVLINTVSKNGGHLASNLGVVELTLALHRVFDSPEDKLIWDVGHQSYTHKLLTGRYKDFSTLRQENGISGFPKPSESAHDAFVSGHSSTSVSLACGFAEAMRINNNKNNYAVAVIGDGAFTGGMVYEALNNAGKTLNNLIVVLNHNNMSISKNVGSLAKYFSSLRSSNDYVKTKFAVERKLNKMPDALGQPISKAIRSSKAAIKRVVIKPTIFDDLGFIYLGPVDGHDIVDIEDALRAAKTYHRPVVVQVNTTKGKGYRYAEDNPGEFHGIAQFDIESGNPEISSSDSFSACFGAELVRLAEFDDKICAVTAAMKYGTGLQNFAKKLPERFFDVGIAEQHAVTFCCGLAASGYKPVFAVYSTFLQRAYDQILHDAALSNSHIVLGIDRAGIVGDDGETHQGVFDVAMLTNIPNVTIYSPYCYSELKMCLSSALFTDTGVCAVRYPRGKEESCADSEFSTTDYRFLHSDDKKVLCASYGRLVGRLLDARKNLQSENIDCGVLKLTKIFPINPECVEQAKQYEKIYFFEEGVENGSIAEHFALMLYKSGFKGSIEINAVDGFIKQATVGSILDRYGFTSEKMALKIKGGFNS